MYRDIMMAIFSGDTEQFDILVRQHSVDVTVVTEPDKWNFLHRALVSVSKTADPRMIRHLIESGIPINAKDRYGNTPLYYAARAKNIEAMRSLLDAGAKVDPVNGDGITPLRELLLKKPYNLEAIDLLLSRGADMHQSNKGGISVKEYAKIVAHGNNATLLDLFEKYDHG
ncbi:MAG: ankyrin repeat domain-containing protein [Anaerolineae bacterium]|nr:ankyrin repeat domain-containing protein [Anaerolineae bacterium]